MALLTDSYIALARTTVIYRCYGSTHVGYTALQCLTTLAPHYVVELVGIRYDRFFRYINTRLVQVGAWAYPQGDGETRPVHFYEGGANICVPHFFQK